MLPVQNVMLHRVCRIEFSDNEHEDQKWCEMKVVSEFGVGDIILFPTHDGDSMVKLICEAAEKYRNEVYGRNHNG